ncbi:uncharacterized protein LOC111615678 [Centruroides sculpturatus]|uniref:uncharacterized protein LOC111615678 n=1 Tax=Centruroides sculpturatus TaxID=218467 RepID=UPI000C6D0C96|nr:uncharacterized protein LOC111615678 [Centruroides sculpturatus]
MKLMFILLTSFIFLNVNAFRIVKKAENVTDITKSEMEIPKKDTKPITDVPKIELTLSKLKSITNCFDDCIWFDGSYCDYSIGSCVCPFNTIKFGTSCLNRVFFLGAFCKVSKQCQTLNSYCYLGKCDCLPGFENYGVTCERKNYNGRKNFKQMDNIVIAVIGTFVGFIVFAIIMSITSYIKKRSSLSSVQVNEVSTVQIPHEFRRGHIPPEFRTVHPPENSGFDATPQTQVNVRANNPREPIISNSDKPPSYEDIMRSSINSSTCNLITHEEYSFNLTEIVKDSVSAPDSVQNPVSVKP